MSVEAALLRAGVPASIAKAEAPRAEQAMLKCDVTTQARARDFLAQVMLESAGLRYFEEIASGAAYEGRSDLGNTHPGDGVRFKGRGPIQLTGRANYRAAGAALGLPLEAQPTLVSRHDIGWLTTAWFWQSHGLNAYADRGDFVGETRRINGGTNGLAQRQHYRAVLGAVDCRPYVDPLTAKERSLVDELERIRAAANQHGWLDTYKNRGASIKKWLRDQMGRIRVAAIHDGKGGWEKARRLERYHLLKRAYLNK